jgi:hypothetical protein
VLWDADIGFELIMVALEFRRKIELGGKYYEEIPE